MSRGKRKKKTGTDAAKYRRVCAEALVRVTEIISDMRYFDQGDDGLSGCTDALQTGNIQLDDAVRLRGMLFRIDSKAEASGQHLGLNRSQLMSAMGAVSRVIEALSGKPWSEVVPSSEGGSA